MNSLHHPKLVQCIDAFEGKSDIVMVLEMQVTLPIPPSVCMSDMQTYTDKLVVRHHVSFCPFSETEMTVQYIITPNFTNDQKCSESLNIYTKSYACADFKDCSWITNKDRNELNGSHEKTRERQFPEVVFLHQKHPAGGDKPTRNTCYMTTNSNDLMMMMMFYCSLRFLF